MKVFYIILVLLIVGCSVSSIIFLIKAIVKRKKIFLWGFFGSLAGVVFLLLLFFATGILFFTFGSFSRYTGAILGNRILLIHDYNYKTIIDDPNTSYNHFNYRTIDNLCEIQYGFFKNNRFTKGENINGELTAYSGPPFSFFVRINELEPDTEKIRFNSVELITNSTSLDLFDFDITYEASYGKSFKHGSYYIWDGTTSINFIKNWRLKKWREINIDKLRKRLIRRQIKPYYSGEELENEINGLKGSCTVSFTNFPTDFERNESVIVKVNFDTIMTDRQVKNTVFEDRYYRMYRTYETRYFEPLESLPELMIK